MQQTPWFAVRYWAWWIWTLYLICLICPLIERFWMSVRETVEAWNCAKTFGTHCACKHFPLRS
jgi:hypothetical protein